MGTKYNIRTSKKKRHLSLEDIFGNPTPYLNVVIPMGSDGSSSHAVVIIDDLIFDASLKFVLKLQSTSLDWSCRSKVIAIKAAIRFEAPRKKTILFKRKMKKNW